MKTAYYIDGGIGRVVASIPAFRKLAKTQEDFKILTPYGDNMFWGIPELQEKVFNTETKGLLDYTLKDVEEIITPEPYRLPAYMHQEVSLAQAFDRIINKTKDHSDLGAPEIVLSKQEELFGKNSIADVKEQQKKDKTIVIQPFGRGAKLDRNVVYDDETRSLEPDVYIALVKRLAVKYNIILYAEQPFHLVSDTWSIKPVLPDLRQWASVIKHAHYFVGCDSSGQHFARAVGTKGTVIFGSTFPVNTSYPDWFNIIEKKGAKKFSPIRISGFETLLANRINERLMNFDNKEIEDIYQSIVKNIDGNKKI
jgi:Glycosyltransferase family 9 (heptosyltransferase)